MTEREFPRFKGKCGLVLGASNRRSLAWAISERLFSEGATLAFSFRRERFQEQVEELARQTNSPLVAMCDATDEQQVRDLFMRTGDAFEGRLDFLVHSIAWAHSDDFSGRFIDTPADRFWDAINSSAYSLVACARAAEPLMQTAGGGAIVTLTYIGGESAVRGYNVMGAAKATLDSCVRYLAVDLGRSNIRINSISAGPVSTLASRGIPSFRAIEAAAEERSALGRGITADDVAAAAAFLLSDDAANLSATRLFVDAGYHAVSF